MSLPALARRLPAALPLPATSPCASPALLPCIPVPAYRPPPVLYPPDGPHRLHTPGGSRGVSWPAASLWPTRLHPPGALTLASPTRPLATLPRGACPSGPYRSPRPRVGLRASRASWRYGSCL